ncbi:MAG: histidinol-phosphate aminotransferase [Pelagibacterales bacterium]|nr:histidinol-phosphate aminotransferase [Pelagibacterales bacterium]
MLLPKPKDIKIERYIGGLSNFRKIDNPIKLSANESALGASSKAIKAFEKDKNYIFNYPESDSNSLRNVISNKFKIDQNRIICGAGSDQIFDLVCKLFLGSGDEVIVSEFGFIMHKIYASLHGAKIIVAEEKNYKSSVENILKKVTDKTKIVFIANPNNPTGTYLSKNEMSNLREKLRSNILLVIDDAYFEFMNKDDFVSGLDLFKEKKNVLITRTFSKIYGLAGLRLGWGYSSKEIIEAMYQIKPPFNVNRAALAAGIEAIKDTEWTQRAIEHNTLWAKRIFTVLEKQQIISNKPTANFFLINFDKTKISAEVAFEKLANNRLILRKMVQYKIPNSLRLTIGNKEANEHFIKTIMDILK